MLLIFFPCYTTHLTGRRKNCYFSWCWFLRPLSIYVYILILSLFLLFFTSSNNHSSGVKEIGKKESTHKYEWNKWTMQKETLLSREMPNFAMNELLKRIFMSMCDSISLLNLRTLISGLWFEMLDMKFFIKLTVQN